MSSKISSAGSRFIFGIIALTVVLALAGVTGTSAQSVPDRGFQAGNGYAISDIETINTTNGNLMLNLPVASLPKGRGTSPGFTVALSYNSKLYNSQPEYHKDGAAQQGETGGTGYNLELLNPSDSGGWHLGMDHRLKLEFRYNPNLGTGFECTDTYELQKFAYINKLHLVMPNGAETEMMPVGYSNISGDGFYKISPYGDLGQISYVNLGGGSVACNYTVSQAVTTGMTYAADDGSGMRLFIPGGQPKTDEPARWTLYYPDGRIIEHNPADDTSLRERITDRNGNRVIIKSDTFNGAQAWKIADDVGHAIYIQSSATVSGATNVYWQGVGGIWLKTEILWKDIYINRLYEAHTGGDGLPSAAQTQQTLYTNLPAVDKITLPTAAGSLQYQFTYNAADTDPEKTATTGWGELNSVTLPTGAKTEYQYWDATAPTAPLKTQEVLKNYVTEKTLRYEESYDGAAPATKTEVWHYAVADTYATITAPDGGITQQFFKGTWKNVSWDSGLVHTVSAPNGTVVRKQWLNKYLVDKEFTSIANNLTIARDYDYDLNGNVTSVKEYDFYTGAVTSFPSGAVLRRETVNEYYNPTVASTDASIKLKGLVKSTEIRDGGGTPVSRSEFYYDDANNTGNVTETRTWDSTKQATLQAANGSGYKLVSANYITAAVAYDVYGNPTITTDAKGYQTQFTYGSVGGYTGLYPTQTVSAYGTSIARTSTAAYDFSTGLVTTATDADNNVSTTTTYDDLGRPIKVAAAAGTPLEVWTQTVYDDANRRLISKADVAVKGDARKVAVQFYDQLGRVRLSKSLEDAAIQSATNETDGIKVQTRYKTASGYTYQLTSNPYRAATSAGTTNEESMGWTLSTANANGKHSQVETFAGAGLPIVFGGGNTASTGKVQTDTDADRTLVTDQAGKQRMSRTNALGQLTDVWEITAADSATTSVSFPNQTLSAGYQTSYQYDTLSNLVTVNQGSQTRSFAYSSLSRLKSAANPESGTIQYAYDDNGNLTSKTDARAVTTNYAYDALNRVTSRTYTDGVTLPVSYTYDNLTNAKGKLTKVVTGSGTTPFAVTEYQSFDKMGRVTQSQQAIDGVAYGISPQIYVYNLSGALLEQTYPSGRVVKNVLDNEGDLALVQSKKNGNYGYWNYAKSFTYTAAGAVSSMQLGNGKWESTVFNSRLQPTQIALGSVQNGTDKLKLNFSYNTTTNNAANADNNGNVLSQTITVPTETRGSTTYAGFTATQNYSYDSLNRLKSAEETIPGQTGWKQTFKYDRYGNRNFDYGANPSAPDTTTPNAQVTVPKVVNPEVLTNNNRFKQDQDNDSIPDYLYDASGNTTRDANNKKFTYDAENKQTKVETVNSSGTVTGTLGTYFYDGDGKRVKKVSATETVIFIYDAAGKLVAEYANQIATTPEVSYLTSDHLGSPRINTDQNGQVTSRHDYQPFGEEIYAISGNTARTGYSTDEVRKQFTSYERDTESELDFAQARMYANKLGRFMSIDPSAKSIIKTDPQSWNKYLYVYNRPLNLIDKNGKWPTATHNKLTRYAFKGLTDNEIANINRGNLITDIFSDLKPASTLWPSEAHKHAMTTQGLTKEKAMEKANDFLKEKLDSAKKLQAVWKKEGNKGISGDALAKLGEAIHTYQDATSPSHGFDKTYSIPTKPVTRYGRDGQEFQSTAEDWTTYKRDMDAHQEEESGEPTPENYSSSALQSRAFFLIAFGNEEFNRLEMTDAERQSARALAASVNPGRNY